MQQIEGSTQRNHEGYVNVAPQLGLSGQRGKSFPRFLFPKHKSQAHPFPSIIDYSTYNEFWVRRGRWE